LDDSKRFREKAEKANVKVNFKLYTGMWHNFQMFNAWFPEAKQALADIAEFAHSLIEINSFSQMKKWSAMADHCHS
jgi:acetyl esterase/lipase